MIASNSLSPAFPCAAVMPSSAICARGALITWDRDDGLSGKILHGAIVVGERANLLPVDIDRADQFSVFEHRDVKISCAPRSEGDKAAALCVLLVGGVVGDIEDLHIAFRGRKATKRRLPVILMSGFLPSRFDKCWRRIVECDLTIKAVLARQKRAKVGLADASGALQNCLEYQFQIARRLGNKL